LLFVAGLAFGTAVGLLLAPSAGRDTRRLLTARAREAQDRVEDSGREYLERGRELYERGREMADEAAAMFDEGRRLIEEPERI
jgi:gas vesicle protein